MRRRQLDIYAPEAEDLDGTVLVPNVPNALVSDLDATRMVPRETPHLEPVPEVRRESVPEAPPSRSFFGRSSKKDSGDARQRARSVPPRIGKRDKTTKALVCDKCDGAHETDDCPHFKKPREKHKDAWSMLGKKIMRSAKDDEAVPIVKSARVIRQPGDGSCLFHSLNYGLNGDSSGGRQVRSDICQFLADNPDMEFGDNTFQEWVQYESGSNVRSYVRDMAGSSWGGAIEMAAFSKMHNVNVHVYETCSKGYTRISAFEDAGARKNVNVLYRGRAHYDALVV